MKIKIEIIANRYWLVFDGIENYSLGCVIDKNIYKNLQEEINYALTKNVIYNNVEQVKKCCDSYLKDEIELKLPVKEKNLFIENKNFKTYIMKDNHNNLYKIGKSKNPKVREKTLQSEKASIKIIKTFDKNIEKELHIKFDKFRVRGEWFNLNDIQVKYICTHY